MVKKNLTGWLYVVGGAFIIAALIVLLQSASLFDVNAPQATVALASKPVTPTPAPTIAGKPVRIIVPSRGIDLPVIDGTYNPKDNSWTLTNTKAQFATMTSIANNKAGNTLIYGHATMSVFGHLIGINDGAEADVITDAGDTFVYRFRSSTVVTPSDTSILHYSGPPVLTLQTCTGIWSQNRDLMTFDFVEVKHA